MGESKRKAISKSQRFEIFRRDSFTCQYCGRSAPEVILEVDHLIPVAHGGTNDNLNLVTACRDCNRGKGIKSVADKDSAQGNEKLKELAIRKEQMEMIIEWGKEEQRILEDEVYFLECKWESLTGYSWTESGKQEVSRLVNKYSCIEVLEAMQISIKQYFQKNNEENIEKTFNKIGGICYNRRLNGQIPPKREIHLDECTWRTMFEILDIREKHCVGATVGEYITELINSDYDIYEEDIKNELQKD